MSIEGRFRGWLSIVAALIVLAATAPAAAQEDLDPAAAELFRQGRDLIKQGDWKAGCEKLEASMQRSGAASTLLNLALCRQEEGRIATAWAMAQQALVLNRDTTGKQRRERLQASGQELLAKLEPRLPRLRVAVVPFASGARVEEAGRPLPLDTAVPLDPGEHELVLLAPGRPDTKRIVALREGETLSIELALPALSSEGAAPSSDPGPREAVQALAVAKPAAPDVPADVPIPVWVWVSGGAGLALAGVAVGFAVDAAKTAQGLEEHCGSDLVCDEDPTFDPEPENARKNRGMALAIGFGAGGTAGIVAAIVGLATAPRSASAPSNRKASSVSVSPWAGPGALGAVVSGRF